MKNVLRILFLCVLVLPLLGVIPARADAMADAKQRIDARQDTIAALKDRGVLGENNRGFVEARGALSADENSKVASENSDRGILYAAVASKTGGTPDQAGRVRAKKIAENSRPGVWLQDESGNWHRK
jgi:uncharacterized protein YdbL (DUF1318 family)